MNDVPQNSIFEPRHQTPLPDATDTAPDATPPRPEPSPPAPDPDPQPAPPRVDLSRYTMTVSDVLSEFDRNKIDTSERNVQRWCKAGKIAAIKVDPETRLPTDHDPNIYLIDATSVATRIDTLKKTQGKQVDIVRVSVAEERDDDAPERGNTAATPPRTDGEGELAQKIKDLEAENLTLKIDNAARDQFIAHIKEDRQELIDQLQGFVDNIADKSQKIGQLEARLMHLQGRNNPVTDIERGGDNSHIGASSSGV